MQSQTFILCSENTGMGMQKYVESYNVYTQFNVLIPGNPFFISAPGCSPMCPPTRTLK